MGGMFSQSVDGYRGYTHAKFSPPPQPKKEASTSEVEGEKKKCKACCACPETKRVRDDCIVQHGAENCTELIEAHRKCMKEMGFEI